MSAVHAESILSPCRGYRYLLRLTWGQGRSLLWMGLHPSDSEETEKNIERYIHFSRREGYAGAMVVNLFAYRTKDPEEIPYIPFLAMGWDNQKIIEETIQGADPVVLAWGNGPKSRSLSPMFQAESRSWVHVLRRHQKTLLCLGMLKHGQPKDLRNVSENATLLPFTGLGD